jgi:hypothetical protein
MSSAAVKTLSHSNIKQGVWIEEKCPFDEPAHLIKKVRIAEESSQSIASCGNGWP